ncbi:MAG: hypothetical protein K0Q99_1370 [Clostridia bacterium]|nr:hypothetical protein [Clostridia bacterium]
MLFSPFQPHRANLKVIIQKSFFSIKKTSCASKKSHISNHDVKLIMFILPASQDCFKDTQLFCFYYIITFMRQAQYKFLINRIVVTYIELFRKSL